MYRGAEPIHKILAGVLVLAGGGALVIAAGSLVTGPTPGQRAVEQSEAEDVPVTTSPVAPGVQPIVEQVGAQRAEPMPAADDVPMSTGFDHEQIDDTIEFRTTEAERRVRDFRIVCPQPGKSLSLMNILRAAARQGWREKGAYLHTIVESRGPEVRVYHHIVDRDGVFGTEPHVVMEIDRWSELRLRGIHPDAVMTQCYLQ